jgi:raffinose synthase
MQPDWDMFQSGHPMGAFHAAGRAVSGGPVYVSDRPGAHDFDVLRSLVLSDGTVLRADGVGRPTRDCLFADVTREPVLLKVFNTNRDCAVIGIFNANHPAAEGEGAEVAGSVGLSDAEGVPGREFAALAHRSGRVWRCNRDDRAPVSLGEGDWEIVSYAPVDRGVAVLGLADKLNSTGAVTGKRWTAAGAYEVALRDGGLFVAWTERRPRSVMAAGRAIAFTQDADGGRLTASLSAPGAQSVVIAW